MTLVYGVFLVEKWYFRNAESNNQPAVAVVVNRQLDFLEIALAFFSTVRVDGRTVCAEKSIQNLNSNFEHRWWEIPKNDPKNFILSTEATRCLQKQKKETDGAGDLVL